MNEPLKEGKDQIKFEWFCKKKKKIAYFFINMNLTFSKDTMHKIVNAINQILNEHIKNLLSTPSQK